MSYTENKDRILMSSLKFLCHSVYMHIIFSRHHNLHDLSACVRVCACVCVYITSQKFSR